MLDIGIIVGFLLGSIVTASLAFPAVGRTVARILAVMLLGIGLGFLVWAGVSDYRGERLRPPFESDLLTELGEAYGWGAGFFLGGLVTLVLSFRRSGGARNHAGSA